MDFQTALQKVKTQFGKEILLQSKIVFILSDFQAFSNVPSYRVVLRHLINEGVVIKYVKTTNTNEQCRIIEKFVDHTGFNKEISTNLLDLFYKIYTGHSTANDPNSIIPNNHNSNKKNTVSPKKDTSETEIKTHKSTKLSVLGVKLGETASSLYNAIRQRGGRRGYGFNTYVLSDFAGMKDVDLTILEYQYSKLIHTVLIEKKQLFSRKARVNEFNRLTNLYTIKYGKGIYGLNKWSWSDSNGNNINIRFSDTKLIIEYSYNIPNIQAIESAMKNEAENIYRTELERKRQEELKRKQQEETRRKQEEANNIGKNLMDI